MRTYYLFVIKKEIMPMYEKDAVSLYRTMYNLFRMKKPNFSYGLSIYHQCCDIVSTHTLKDYFTGKYEIEEINHSFSFRGGNIVSIHPSCIVIRTSANLPYLLRIFHYYSRTIFACDFYNQDYFWLSKNYHELRNKEYNELSIVKSGNF